MNNISESMILECLNSQEEFPIEFDEAWRWIGYSQAQKAKKKLFNNFEQGIDYQIVSPKRVKSPQGGRPSDRILLTVDCFKSLAMMAGTGKGREVRKYFLECERRLKAASQPRQHQQLWWDRLVLFQKYTTIPDGFWSIYMELHSSLVQTLEAKGFVFPDRACPDISVGLC
jgi:phage anti-repressor protein